MALSSATQTIRLEGTPLGTRAAHWFVIGAAFLLALTFTGTGVYGAVHANEGSGFMLLVGVISLVGAEALRRWSLAAIAPGQLEVYGPALQVTQPPLLERPLAVSFSNLRVAATEVPHAGEPPEGGADPEDGCAFPIHRGGRWRGKNEVTGHLLAPGTHLPVRSLSPTPIEPNLILLFEDPVATPPLRRVVDGGPSRGEALGGVALRVLDPGQARSLLAAHRVRAEIQEADLERLWQINSGEAEVRAPATLSFQRAERRKVAKIGWASAAGGLLMPLLELWTFVLAVLTWKEGMKWQAAGITLAALAVLALHTNELLNGDARGERGLIIISGVLTLIVFALRRDVWRSRS